MAVQISLHVLFLHMPNSGPDRIDTGLDDERSGQCPSTGRRYGAMEALPSGTSYSLSCRASTDASSHKARTMFSATIAQLCEIMYQRKPNQ